MRAPSRSILTFGSAALFVGCLLAYRPGLGEASVGEALGSLAGFWIVFIVGSILLAIAYAVWNLLAGVPSDAIGLKDERDRKLERRAYGVGFWILFIGSFAAIFATGSDGNQALQTVIVAQVAAIGGILLVALVDELRLIAMERRLRRSEAD